MQDFSGEACSVAHRARLLTTAQSLLLVKNAAEVGMLAWSTSEWTSEPWDDDIYEALKLTMGFSEKSTAKKGPSPQNKGLDYWQQKNLFSVHNRPANAM
ncbi:hypothetical protein AOLI_G00244180 [Acnodon oligacanthus]